MPGGPIVPTGVAVRAGDKLRFCIFANVATAVVGVLHVDIVNKDGVSSQQSLPATSLTDRSGVCVTQPINEDGVIVSASTGLLEGGAPTGPGVIWMGGWVARGTSDLAQLLGGYFYSGHQPTFPNMPVQGFRDGPGNIRVITTADPAANTEVAATAVPANALWRLISYTVSMAQGATQTPRPALLVRSAGTTTLLRIPVNADVAASTTVQCSWGAGLANTENNVTGGEMVAGIPNNLFLVPTDDVLTATQGIGAASDYGAATLVVEEWLFGP